MFPIVMMMLALGALSLIFYRMKHPSIVPCVIIGLVVGGTGLDEKMKLSQDVIVHVQELGMVLVFCSASAQPWTCMHSSRTTR